MNSNRDVYITTELGNISNSNRIGKIKYFYDYNVLKTLHDSPMTRARIDPTTIKRVPIGQIPQNQNSQQNVQRNTRQNS